MTKLDEARARLRTDEEYLSNSNPSLDDLHRWQTREKFNLRRDDQNRIRGGQRLRRLRAMPTNVPGETVGSLLADLNRGGPAA